MPQLRLCLAVVIFLLMSALMGAPAAQQPTFLGVIDRDGLLTPIAVYNAGDWWNRWPWQPESDPILLPTPVSVAAIPDDWLPPSLRFPLQWQAFERSGRLVPFRASGVEYSPPTALMRTFLIRTNYRGAARSHDERVAISGPGVLGRFVVPSSREQDALVRQLQDRLAALEAVAVEEWTKQREAGREPVALTRTFRIDGSFGTRYVGSPPRNNRDVGLVKAETTIAGRSYYYLSGEKLFKLRPDGDCMMNLSSEGFVVAGRDRRVLTEKIASAAFAEYCGDPAESLDLLATIRVGNRHWWIMRSAFEDGYDYGLLDPLSGAPVVLKGLWGTR